jgi:hypothetical protein
MGDLLAVGDYHFRLIYLAIIILGLFIALRTSNDRNNEAKKDVHTAF